DELVRTAIRLHTSKDFDSWGRRSPPLDGKPQEPDAWGFHDQGVARQRGGNHHRAIELFDQALAQDPAGGEFWFRKGLSLAALGDHASALQCFDHLLKLAPVVYRAPLGQAVDLRQPLFSSVVYRAHVGRAVVLGQVGRFADAFAALREALSLPAYLRDREL